MIDSCFIVIIRIAKFSWNIEFTISFKIYGYHFVYLWIDSKIVELDFEYYCPVILRVATHLRVCSQSKWLRSYDEKLSSADGSYSGLTTPS